MGARYLLELPDVVRRAGLVLVLEPGWETRARSSGGYDAGRPDHVMVHHTASNPGSDPHGDVDYMCHGSDSRPVANLYLSRSGAVTVMAAGATNTNGTGTCPHCGTTDNMNVRAVGIEAANNGVGEPWPVVQQDAYVALVAELEATYRIAPQACQLHATYAPGRKIDPAGPSRYATGSATWNLDAFRADVAAGGIPPLEEEEILVPYVLKNSRTGAAIVVEPSGLRSIGGAELNYLDSKFDVVNVPDGDEWQMALAARTRSVDVVGD